MSAPRRHVVLVARVMMSVGHCLIVTPNMIALFSMPAPKVTTREPAASVRYLCFDNSGGAAMTTDKEMEGGASWKPPLMAALAVLCTGGPLFWSRNFGLFLLLYPYVFGVGAICLVLFGLAPFGKTPRARLTRAVTALSSATALAVLFFTAAPASDFLHDRLGFLIWYTTHRNVARQYAHHDAIIMTWDSWGIAGLENDSYLISDPDDSIGTSTANAARWIKRVRSSCGVAGAVRLKRGLYILTTENCPLTDGRSHAA